ncbi:MAG TPA: site-2 protease family protein [Solirubrobacterales bacterium]|nr:site-2 protease family protein [Solirubrobacterales bacterium]
MDPASPATDPAASSGEPAAPAPSRAGEDRTLLKRIGGGFAAVGLLALKLGAKLKALLVVLPKLKLPTTSASMLVSIGAYALIWGWSFAVGFVLLLLVHEMGHVLQLRREGIPASAPMFIPFLGAVVAMKALPDDAGAEARVGLAGPVLGSLGALVPLGIYALTGDELFKALAFVGFFLNLFNLLPVLPLDGGRAMAALSPALWLVGFGLLVAAAIAFPNPIMILILVFGGIETWRRWRARKSPEAQQYHRVSGRTRALVAAVYLGLAVLLAVGMDATFIERDFGDV